MSYRRLIVLVTEQPTGALSGGLEEPTETDIRAWLDAQMEGHAILRGWEEHVTERQLARELTQELRSNPRLEAALLKATGWRKP